MKYKQKDSHNELLLLSTSDMIGGTFLLTKPPTEVNKHLYHSNHSVSHACMTKILLQLSFFTVAYLHFSVTKAVGLLSA